MLMEFEWDGIKNQRNLEEHGLTLERASTIWDRPNALFILADDRDYDEDRYLAFGFLSDGTLLIVVHTYRGENIRLISAREVDAKERKQYYANLYRR